VSGKTLDEWCLPDVQAGIGVALGYNGVVAIDLDYGSAEINEAIEQHMPATPYKKVGAKGYTAFYHASREVGPVKFNLVLKEGDRPKSVCEILSGWNQTVIPPTIHPDTGNAYVWEDEPLSMCMATALPQLPDNFAELIAESLKPFGGQSKILEQRGDDGGICPGGEYDGRAVSSMRMVNNAALETIHIWVPKLDKVTYRLESDGSARMIADWRGGDDYNIGATRNGIKDFTGKDGGPGGGMTPIDLVMLAQGMSTAGEALGWLVANGLPEWNKLADGMVENARKKREAVEAAVADYKKRMAEKERLEQERLERERLEEASRAAAAESANRAELSAEMRAMIDGAHPRDWQTGDMDDIAAKSKGLVADMIQYLTEISETPSKTIAMTAALGFGAMLFGRWWAIEDKNAGGLRTYPNIYVFGSAGSGMGKSSAMSAAKKLFYEAIDRVMVDDRYSALRAMPPAGDDGADPAEVERAAEQAPFMSDVLRSCYYGKTIHAAATLHNRMIECPNTLMFVDEASQFARKVWPERSNNNAEGMQAQIKMLITEADGVAEGTDYTVKSKNQGNVMNPSFSMVLMATGSEFVRSLPLETYRDGLLGRVLWLQDKSRPRLVEVNGATPGLRDRIINRMADIIRTRLDAGDMTMGGFALSSLKIDPVIVPMEPEAIELRRKAKHMLFEEGVRAAEAKRADSELWHRCLEVALRVAIIHALGTNHYNPIVTVDDLVFGLTLATFSISQVAKNADKVEAESLNGVPEFVSKRDRVLKVLARHGGEATASVLSQALKMRRKEIDDILATMASSEMITVSPGARKGSFIVRAI